MCRNHNSANQTEGEDNGCTPKTKNVAKSFGETMKIAYSSDNEGTSLHKHNNSIIKHHGRHKCRLFKHLQGGLSRNVPSSHL